VKISVAYWIDKQVVIVEGRNWRLYPVDNVLWVDIERDGLRQRLQGMDNYWVDGHRFGMFNDFENEWLYEGVQHIAYIWPLGAAMKRVPGLVRSLDAHILRGVMVPDETARQLGLL